jgi:CHAT domain-containing protein/Tfp pilus assembly protein PilF
MRTVLLTLVLAAFASAAATGTDQLRTADPRVQAVQTELTAGRYLRAETDARELVADVAERYGQRSLEAAQATDLLIAALVGVGKGAASETRVLAEGVIRIKESIVGPDHIELALSLRHIGDVLVGSGEYRQAIDYYERGVRIRERNAGGMSLGLAEDLDHLASAFILAGRFGDASTAIARALGIKESILSSNDTGVARSFEIQAQAYERRGEYALSRSAVERSLSILRAGTETHPHMASALSLFGVLLRIEGNLAQARVIHAQALRVAEEVLGADHPDIATYLLRQALTESDFGEFAHAQILSERALAIAERAFGPGHLIVADHVNFLANMNLSLGDYTKARPQYERVLQLSERVPGPTDVKATVSYNLGLLDARLGDFLESRREFERAIAMWEQLLGPQHRIVGRARSALAELLNQQGRYEEARVQYERALAIRETALGANHPDVARTLGNLAGTLARLGRRAEAQALSARALRIWEQSGAVENTGFLETLVGHAKLQADQGDFAGSRQSWMRALDIRTRILGSRHPAVGEAEAELAGVLATTGEAAEAYRRALHAEELGREHLRLVLLDLAERQALAYAAVRPKGLDLALSLDARETAAPVLFDAVIQGRALVFDEMAARRRSAAQMYEAGAQPLWEALSSSRQRLANLIVRGATEGREKQYQALIEEARRDKEQAERALAEVSATFRAQLALEAIGFREVRAALPAGYALVSFVRYDRTVLREPNGTSARSGRTARSRIVPSYLAFVLRSDQTEPSVVTLGAADVIEPLVRQWRSALAGVPAAGAERSYRTVAAALRQRVWDPVVTHVRDADTVLVVPDGALNLVSFAALPTGNGGYLGEEGPRVHYLVSERDLVATRQPSSGRGLLAVGSPAYDGSTQPVTSPKTSAASRSGCGTLQSIRFGALPGTRLEVNAIAQLWRAANADAVADGGPTRVLTGAAATEKAFKQGAPGTRVLHLATHGFFLDGECAGAARGTRAVGGVTSGQGKPQAVAENPLHLSGLALAGANRRARVGAGDEDGILTAEEVVSLNLEGVEWAVLSACDTGVGETRAGEGVLGLRRAFQIAGARTLIMSLWSVDDEATTSWMRALYRARLQDRVTTAEAVHAAGLSVLRERRAKGQSTHPFYWAAFVAAGDWQ